MVKKLQKIAAKKEAAAPLGSFGQLLDGELASTVKESAQQIWLAGLGAFAKAQEEGSKVFESLVKEGVSIQRRTQAVAEERLGDVASKMTGLAGEVQSKAGQSWDKLETIFEERVAKALNRLGVPSSKDIDALIARIDALAAQVGGPAAARKAAPARKAQPAKKAAPAKKAPAKRAPRKPAA